MTNLWVILSHTFLKAIIQCVKSVCIRSYSGPHFPAFGLNNSEYGHFPQWLLWNNKMFCEKQFKFTKSSKKCKRRSFSVPRTAISTHARVNRVWFKKNKLKINVSIWQWPRTISINNNKLFLTDFSYSWQKALPNRECTLPVLRSCMF